MTDINDPIFEHERLELPPTLEYRPELVIPIVVGAGWLARSGRPFGLAGSTCPKDRRPW